MTLDGDFKSFGAQGLKIAVVFHDEILVLVVERPFFAALSEYNLFEVLGIDGRSLDHR